MIVMEKIQSRRLLMDMVQSDLICGDLRNHPKEKERGNHERN
jgi:hypothetical protein